MSVRRTIETRADLRELVDAFYLRLLADPRIAHLFRDLDLAVHMPILVDFWAMVLLAEDSYRSNTFQKHLHLAIEEPHFAIWLSHFEATLEEHFEGERADLAQSRARSIAAVFRSKLHALGRLTNRTDTR
ncbi:MAG: group III truncated hemoglobin [Planctomycetota bacterium]|nr:group III truncated hemoglobin [Planctomycetota bacterium]